ncbi:glycosyltransferase [Lysobacter sp. F6437]|uniref:glycosyltransferase n=1 Tax=Lysobacter sp. F6437 TaxID=3459296 RepID=UPI00403DD5FA
MGSNGDKSGIRNPDEARVSTGHAPDASGVASRERHAPDIRNELADEVSRSQDEARRLRESLRSAMTEQHRMIQLLGRAQGLIQGMENGVRELQGSVSLQLGYLIIQSTRSIKGVLTLPVRAFRLLRSARRNQNKITGRDRGVVAVPLPHEWFAPELRDEIERFHSDLATHPDGGLHGRQSRSPRRVSRFGVLPNRLEQVRIASIMDEFTFNAFSECCETTQVTATDWRDEVDAIRPHFLFIESAWDGKDSTWQRQISATSGELRKLVAHCRQSGIPVVFWSKEDPVHFKTFLDTAKLADVVFTTDIDCIRHYKQELGHEQVYLLPFATQPRAHNPVEHYDRKPGFCFAGSYYVRYPVRQRDFDSILHAVAELGEVDIYDRNHGKDHPNYKFPEHYRPYILGNLRFDQIDIAYKGYDFGININTVKHSQSMFARRVFDLLASNTTVVSNFSRGMRLMFGDLVVSSDDRAELVSRLRPLTEDVVVHRKHRLLGLRKVLSQHTYHHRLEYLLDKVFAHAPRREEPHIHVLARVASEAELVLVLESFRRQLYPAKTLVLCFEGGYLPAESPAGEGVQVISANQSAVRTVASLDPHGYVGVFHSADYYGPNYLQDLALATLYVAHPLIGKSAYYCLVDGAPELREDGSQYRIGKGVSRRRAIARAADFEGETIARWLDDIDLVLWGDVTAVDEFNYCEGGGGRSAIPAVDDLGSIDPGIPVAQLFSVAEGIHADSLPGKAGQRDESIGMPSLEAAALIEGLGTLANKYLSISIDGPVMQLTSTVPSGQPAYAYMDATYEPQELQFTDIAKMQLVSEGHDGLSLVLVYLDAAGEKISHSLLRAGANLTVSVPAATHRVQIGLRATKPGVFRIRRLVFDHVPLPVSTFVTRSRHLLLAKNYPSYDDLYKHAFVHRRVMAYRRLGVDVDVFRIGSEALNFYEFEGVDVAHGQADHLRAMLRSGGYSSLLVHVLDERMWDVVKEFVDTVKVFVWAHGSEMQSAGRREFEHLDATPEARARAVALGERRMRFWRRIFSEHHPNLRMIFVSEWAARDIMADVGVALQRESYRVIHNFIDTELFSYKPKVESQRKRILSIRPFVSKVYANDLTVAAIVELSTRACFAGLEFRIVGDGPLFEETVSPLRGFSNVVIEQRFLSQREIAAMHQEYGVFLVPSRMDSQGVSRDEAMASGLVPVTTRVAAIPEFVDETCGLLSAPEDAMALADQIECLHDDPALFSRLSTAAAARVRSQSGEAQTIAREVAMFSASRIRGRPGDSVHAGETDRP